MQLLLISSVITALLAGSIHIFHDSINLYLMGFFRDLSRIKARKRRMKNNLALSTESGFTRDDLKMLFLKQEEDDPLADVDILFDFDEGGKLRIKKRENGSSTFEEQDLEDYRNIEEYTREELYEMGNGDNEEGIILLSIFGRVYDVSHGWKYYGEGAKYYKFAGRDVTRALSTGCMANSCLGSRYTESKYTEDDFDLTPKTIAEGKKWVSFFETHDKYRFVGFLKDGRSIDALVDEELSIQEKQRRKV